jgi:hypothetical protein
MKKDFHLNYEEYLISQVFHNNFKSSRLSSEGKEIIDEKLWEERIICIYEDCHYHNNLLERGHLRDLLRDTEFESTDFKLIILEG